jgi:hypothetical protein
LLDVELVLGSLDVELVVDVLELGVRDADEHAFAGEWRTGAGRNEADLAGSACVLRFPSPLRRRYAAGPAYGSLIGARLRMHERARRAVHAVVPAGVFRSGDANTSLRRVRIL